MRLGVALCDAVARLRTGFAAVRSLFLFVVVVAVVVVVVVSRAPVVPTVSFRYTVDVTPILFCTFFFL